MPRLRTVLLCAIGSFIVCVTVLTFFLELKRVERIQGAIDQRMAELVETTRKNQELREKISYYKTPAGIAHLAREEFNLVGDGEKIYRIEVVSGDTLPNN